MKRRATCSILLTALIGYSFLTRNGSPRRIVCERDPSDATRLDFEHGKGSYDPFFNRKNYFEKIVLPHH
jgi:hypothetical protein